MLNPPEWVALIWPSARLGTFVPNKAQSADALVCGSVYVDEADCLKMSASLLVAALDADAAVRATLRCRWTRDSLAANPPRLI